MRRENFCRWRTLTDFVEFKKTSTETFAVYGLFKKPNKTKSFFKQILEINILNNT